MVISHALLCAAISMKCRILLFLLALASGQTLGEELLTFPENIQARGPNGRIVSGWEAEEGQFRHQVSLRAVTMYGSVYSCGASVIHEEWALTAAHCTAWNPTLVLRVGVTNQTLPYMIFDTCRFYNHPLYNEANAGIVQAHDIGLIKFPVRVEFNHIVQPVRLQSSRDKNMNYDGKKLIASGWGVTWTWGEAPEVLNWVYLTGVTNEFCRRRYNNARTIVDSTICARYYNVTSQSTCQGDSGGPLSIVDSDGVVTVVGVTSFTSRRGCHAGEPAGFVRPGHYHDWFLELTGINFDW